MAVEHDEAVASVTASRRKRAASRPVSNGGEATACPVSSSRFRGRGVHLRCPGKYTVRIRDPGQQQFAGEAAGIACDAAAIRLHGAAAKTNFQHPAAAATKRRPGYFGVHGTPSGEHGAQIWLRTAAEEAARADQAAAATTNSNHHGDDGDAPPLRVPCEGEAPGDAEKNKKKRAAPRSGFRGVYLHPRSGRYSAQIRDPERRGKLFWLGSFATGEEAARAYDAAAVTLYGDKAVTNYEQPPDGEESPMDLFPELRSNFQAWRKEVAALGSRSGHVGVHPYRGKYSAQIWDPVRRADQWLDTFGAAEETAGAYDAAAVRTYGAAAETNFKKQRSAAAADDGEVSAMDLNEFQELPALDFFPGSITPDAQLDDLLTGLPLVELQQVDELLKDMGFTDMVA